MDSWWPLETLYWGLVLALLILRRWRHLLVWWLAANLVGFLTVEVLARLARRPRPFGVDLQASWGDWALPSVQIAAFTAVLVGILYALVPAGRWRQTGKWVATALVAAVAVAHIALGVDAPATCWLG